MKKLFFFIGILLSLSVHSSHFATANLHYQYIGNQTNVPNQYLITLDFYGEITGVQWPQFFELNSISTCGVDTTTALDLTSFNQNEPLQLECAGQFGFIINTYIDTLVLDPCADWDFKVITSSRSPNSNLDLNFPNAFGFCFNAKLNNLNGQNSTATAFDPHPKWFCVGKEFYWERNYTDQDGDSLWISPNYIQGTNTLGAQLQLQYSAPNSLTSPFPIDPSVGYNLNSKNGDLYFKPDSSSTLNYLGYRVEEYRKTPNNTWTKVGQRYGETAVIIKDTCHNSVLTPFANQDTVRAVLGDTSISFGTTSEFFKFSAVPSDLFIHSPILQPVSVKSIQAIGLSSAKADSLRLGTFSPLTKKGIYKLVLREGLDGNSFLMSCGSEFDKTDTLYIDVDAHAYVGVRENDKLNFALYPNPAKNVLIINSVDIGLKTATIFTLSGMKLDEFRFKTSEISLKTSSYESGVYFIRIASELGVSTQRFLVKR